MLTSAVSRKIRCRTGFRLSEARLSSLAGAFVVAMARLANGTPGFLSTTRHRNFCCARLAAQNAACRFRNSPMSANVRFRRLHRQRYFSSPIYGYRLRNTRPIELVDTTRALLLALRDEKIAFTNLNWMQMEDIVAELLRSRGLQVWVTPRSRDGGRDIIACRRRPRSSAADLGATCRTGLSLLSLLLKQLGPFEFYDHFGVSLEGENAPPPAYFKLPQICKDL